MTVVEQKSPSDQSRSFQCHICFRGFNRQEHLVRHIRIHTGERPYKCPHCDKRFSRQDEMSRHSKIHTEYEKSGLKALQRASSEQKQSLEKPFKKTRKSLKNSLEPLDTANFIKGGIPLASLPFFSPPEAHGSFLSDFLAMQSASAKLAPPHLNFPQSANSPLSSQFSALPLDSPNMSLHQMPLFSPLLNNNATIVDPNILPNAITSSTPLHDSICFPSPLNIALAIMSPTFNLEDDFKRSALFPDTASLNNLSCSAQVTPLLQDLDNLLLESLDNKVSTVPNLNFNVLNDQLLTLSTQQNDAPIKVEPVQSADGCLPFEGYPYLEPIESHHLMAMNFGNDSSTTLASSASNTHLSTPASLQYSDFKTSQLNGQGIQKVNYRDYSDFHQSQSDQCLLFDDPILYPRE